MSKMQILSALFFLLVNTSLLAQRDTVTYNGGVEEHWSLAFYDDFNGKNVDRNKWDVRVGVVRDIEQNFQEHWFAAENCVVDSGKLMMHVKRDTLLNQPFSVWVTDRMVDFKDDFYFSSAEIDSKQTFHYGMYEIRCKIPTGKGIWPAFWMFESYDHVNYEIDVFEFWNQKGWVRKFVPGKTSRYQNMTLHHNGRMSGMRSGRGPDYSEDFHTFTVIWDECKIQWYTDGKLMRTQYRYERMKGRKTGCETPMEGDVENVFPDMPMKIILDVAVQSKDARPDDSNIFPDAMEVDYVRYYVKK